MASSSPPPRASMLLYWQENQYDDDRNLHFHGRTIFSVMALFSVILFFAVLTLYIHRSCLARDPINVHEQTPPIFTQCTGGGLDPAEIRSLPVVLCRREAAEEERECCICLGGLEEGEKMKVLPLCRHCYHCECVDRWLMAESSCPLCRVSIRVDSSVALQ